MLHSLLSSNPAEVFKLHVRIYTLMWKNKEIALTLYLLEPQNQNWSKEAWVELRWSKHVLQIIPLFIYLFNETKIVESTTKL